ncbi:MAG: uncharacterized protein A8A55_2913, partial [Amphiamblys sp. WSBS2006]
MTQGAKEQGLLNRAVAGEKGLRTAWLDVKKAYDTVSHRYLKRLIGQKLGVPEPYRGYLLRLVDSWETTLILNREAVGDVKFQRGIPQGDSLSPLLFVLSLEPVSRMLNRMGKVEEVSAGREVGTNHLLFVDDIKLYARDKETLAELLHEAKSTLQVIGLEINHEKSATNEKTTEQYARLMREEEGYKYLGVCEDTDSNETPETKQQIMEKVLQRVESLARTKLKALNLFKAINEHALSVLNYYFGLVPFTDADIQYLDTQIRAVLIRAGAVERTASTERLYMHRREMGRGLQKVEFLEEVILTQLDTHLHMKAPTCDRCHQIVTEEAKKDTRLSNIRERVQAKYAEVKTRGEIASEIRIEQLEGLQLFGPLTEEEAREKERNETIALVGKALKKVTPVTGKNLRRIQQNFLLERLSTKTQHRRAIPTQEYIDLGDSANWLTRENCSPQREGKLCDLQDHNLLGGKRAGAKCLYCKKATMTIDHLATRCGAQELLAQYSRRHDAALASVHLALCISYGLKKVKKIGQHVVSEYREGRGVTITTNIT